MVGRSVVVLGRGCSRRLGQLLRPNSSLQPGLLVLCNLRETLASSEPKIPSLPTNALRLFSTFAASAALSSEQRLLPNRSLSSAASSPGPSKIVPINSEEDLKSALRKADDESLPSIFYFTAVWCGPCRLIAPTITEISEKYRNVTIYKIDIDQVGLQTMLGKLQIMSVPTFHFFSNGKKVYEISGADADGFKKTMEKYYKSN